jgi:formylglycine-generating enzyme required for sulfatase activity
VSEPFDPYYQWLGIPRSEQPPDHYRLLGVARFESDPQVIRTAVEQRFAYLRTFQLSKYSDRAEQLLNEIAAAKACLLDPKRKAAYDARLEPVPSEKRIVPPPLPQRFESARPAVFEPVSPPQSRRLSREFKWRLGVCAAAAGLLLLVGAVLALGKWLTGDGGSQPPPAARATAEDVAAGENAAESRPREPQGQEHAVGNPTRSTPAAKPASKEPAAAAGHTEARGTRTGKPGEVVANSIGMKLVLISAGEFLMGTHSAEETAQAFAKYEVKVERFKDEQPQHPVRITRPFYLGQCEVTVAQFRQFVAETRYQTEAEKNQSGSFGYDPSTRIYERKREYTWRNPGFEQSNEHPVVHVNWNDAVAFCEWLSRRERRTYRLPTEAEWEYACRAGTTSLYSNGNDPERLVEIANVADASSRTRFPNLMNGILARDGYVFTAPVGRFRANAFGLYDMHGNVWEWCADWYAEGYYATSPAADPQGPDAGESRIFRGGSWGSMPDYYRSACRNGKWWSHFMRTSDLGFRVCQVLAE